jgi:8-oxo-dGTP diphosphatase
MTRTVIDAPSLCPVRSNGKVAGTSVEPAIGVRVDAVLLTLRAGRLSVLLVPHDEPPFEHTWALPGGPVRLDEDLDSGARRLLAQETGVHAPGHLEQLRTYGAVGRDPRGRAISVAYLALLPDLPRPPGDPERPTARWWAVEDLQLEQPVGSPSDGARLALDHAAIIADGVERARAKLEYTSLATAFVDEPFTLADLRRVYEAAWGVALDPPNFRRKVLSTPGFVVPLGERVAPRGGGRPAALYRRGWASSLHPPLLRRENGPTD